MVGVVDRPIFTPGEVEVHRYHDVGTGAPQGAGDIAAQRQTRLHHAVGVPEEVDPVHADDGGAPAFFLLAQGAGLSGAIPSMPASPSVTST